MTIKDFFFFQGLFYLSAIIFEAPVGYLSDVISRKKLIILSFGIFFLITLLWLSFHGYYLVLIGEILFALSKVIMDNTMSGYLYDFLNNNNKKEEMTKYYGRLNFFLSIGTTVAALIGTGLYKLHGLRFIIICESLILLLAIVLIHTLPNFKSSSSISFKNHLKGYYDAVKSIILNSKIKYHILYSGFLTSFSILFATSFQPLMLNALCPIALFGIIASINHGIRALAGIVAGKINFSIKKIIKPLFCLYLLAFGCVFIILHSKNIFVITILLILVCLIIGAQVIFTIMHVSRLHNFISTSARGSVMAVNNTVTRILTTVFLISSKFFINKTNLDLFFFIILIVFIVFCSCIMIKSYKVEE